jgi:hypothetical protein
MSKRGTPHFRPPAADAAANETITIPLAEYVALNRLATLLEIILHDHTPYHDAVGIVKNVLIDQMAKEDSEKEG